MISCESERGKLTPNQEVIKKGYEVNFTYLVETAQFQIVSFAVISYLILFNLGFLSE